MTANLQPHTDFLWLREDYEDLVRRGVFGPEDHLEVLNGRVITMAPQQTPHAIAYTLTHRYPSGVSERGYHVRAQLPLALDERSEPEPDLAVVRGEVRDYLQHRPTPNDSVLVVEVSDSSLRYDCTEELAAYARAGIPEYWILKLIDRVIEAHRDPTEDSHGKTETIGPEGSIAPRGYDTQSVTVAELLP